MNALKIILPQEDDQPQRHFDDLVEYIGCQETHEMSESEIERELEKRGRELMRVLLQEHLNNRSPGQSCHLRLKVNPPHRFWWTHPKVA